MTVPSEAKKLAADALIKLYTLDATDLGGEILRFVSSTDARMLIDTLTSSGLTATCNTINAHAMLTGDSVKIEYADQPEYNGSFFVTVTDANTFTYQLSSGSISPATGLNLIATRLNGTMVFDGNKYFPQPIHAEGFERNSQGASPRPKLSVSNTTRILMAGIITLNDLVGATFTRQRTFRKHLDDGSDPDPTAVFPLDVFRINRKLRQNKKIIEFELASPTDQQGALIPARQCLKRTCSHRYRRLDPLTGTFDYTKATCPYSADAYFTQRDVASSDLADDVCGKQLSSCKKRFGTQPLPTRAFPGIGGL